MRNHGSAGPISQTSRSPTLSERIAPPRYAPGKDAFVPRARVRRLTVEIDPRGMALTHLILSLDYEVLGNGAGDVRRDVVYPTGRLLDICDRHGAKMTIMFEVGEYWAFERYDEQLQHDLGYSPFRAMKEQVIDATRRGHDVQLHLHPQWIDAEYDKSSWQLRNSYWRLADLPDGLGSEKQVTSIVGALHRGKQTLENMLQPVKTDYECACFRAGGFYAQPSRHIIRAMKRIGLRADSSVVKGFRKTEPFVVDYSQVETSKAAWWTTDTDLTQEGPTGTNILELPVSSRMEPYWKSFKPAKIRAALRRRRIEHAHHNGNGNGNGPSEDHGDGRRLSSVPSWQAVMKRMLREHASMFDFCKLSCRDMVRRMREHSQNPEQPVVLIGHSKDFVNDWHLDRFLTWLSRNEVVHSVTFSEYLRRELNLL